MRKLILILFILLSCVSLANSGGIISFPGGGVPSNSCTIPGSPDIEFATHSTDGTLVIGAAEGLRFDSGAGGDLAKICIESEYKTEASTMDMRIGTTDILTNAGTGMIEDLGTSISITETQWVCWESATNPTLTGSTNYFVGVMLNSGNAEWNVTEGDPAGGVSVGWSYNSAWDMGSIDTDLEYTFRLYYCD